MTIVLALFGLGVAMEIALYMVPGLWRVRKVAAVVALLSTAFASGAICVRWPSLWSGLLLAASLYRGFNMVRVVEGRMHEHYLRYATRRTTFFLLGMQGVIAALWLVWQTWHTTGQATWVVVCGLQAGGGVLLLISTIRNLRRTQWPAKTASLPDADLPTVTVAIPARNETDDLQLCLASLIANDYPKLEIIVLDDCSQNRRTPEIIRGFAHDGVRFIQGAEPSETWLPKNQAYHRLVGEASGDYILFCGVDVRFAPGSIRQLVTTMHARKKQMLSVLPLRRPEHPDRFTLVQAMRYWWELVPPRRWFNRPPVLSSCWMITAVALHQAGGFQAVARSITPEAYFAKQLLSSDGYSFLRADTQLGIQSTKSANEQRDTAIRTRYPQLHRRPEQVFVAALAEKFFLLLPFGLAVGGFWLPIGGVAQGLAVIAAACLAASYVQMAHSTRINSWWFGLVALPVVTLVDIVLLHISMWQYEFSTVEWRGRNVCVPVMHVVPHLPAIK